MKAMTPERRTELLANSMQDVAFGFGCALFFSAVPVLSLALGGFLAMGLLGCAAVVEPTAQRWLRLSAACAVASGVVSTVHFFVPALVQGWLVATVGVGVFAAAHGFSGVAAWFGGVQRWQRARSAAVAWLCSISLLVGIGLGQRPQRRIGSSAFQLPGGLAAGLAVVVSLAALLHISMAYSDLRSRVKAAIAQQAAAAREPVRG